MQINMTTDYAVRTLLCLLQREEGSLMRTNDIAEEIKIPYNYVQKVVASLKTGGYMEAVRGQFGGYRLTPIAYTMTVYDVVNLYEGEKIHRSLEEDYKGSEFSSFALFCELIQEKMDEVMKSITLKELSKIHDKENLLKSLLKKNGEN